MSKKLSLTPFQGAGPFYGYAIVRDGIQNAVEPGSPGAITITGRVLDGAGKPVPPPDGLLEFYSAEQFARTMVDGLGGFEVTLKKPEPFPLPDGTTQAPFIFVDVHIFPINEGNHTRIYFPDEEEANARDTVLNLVSEAERDSLIAQPDGENRLKWDVILSGENQTAFLAPLTGPSLAHSTAPKMPVHAWNGAKG
jgi:protocatechuate 3,4-dioxygenase alpha subunit